MDGFDVGGHSIKNKYEISTWTFDVLTLMLAKDTQDLARYTVIDGEIMKRLAKDNAAIHLTNAILGGYAGRIFGLLGVFLGACVE